jgi:hypothetical protein
VAVRTCTRLTRCADQAASSARTIVESLTGQPRPARSSSVIASRSTVSVLMVRLPITRRCSVTCAGLSSSSSQPAGQVCRASSGWW